MMDSKKDTATLFSLPRAKKRIRLSLHMGPYVPPEQVEQRVLELTKVCMLSLTPQNTPERFPAQMGPPEPSLTKVD